MKKLLFFAAFALTATLFTACSNSDNTAGSSDTPATPANSGEVVLMYYAVGGANLDYTTETQLGKIGLNLSKYPNVRTFVQLKYSAKKHDSYPEVYEPSGEYGSVYRFEINKQSSNPDFNGDVNKAKAFAGEGFRKFAGADFNMYEPQNLTDFINWCIKEAPGAKAYVLAFGDHGGSYDMEGDYNKALTRGVMYDDNIKGSPCMSLAEITTAISNVPQRINMIFFDLCIMNNLEVLGELQGHTDYVFASGHSVIESPLPELCVALSKVPTAATVNEGIETYMGEYVHYITKYMIPSFKEDPSDLRIDRSMDYTLTDMSKLPALFTTIKSVADYLKQYVGNLSEAELKDKTEAFDFAAGGTYQYVNNACYYDVVSYLEQLEKFVFPGDTKFSALVDDVVAAVKECHVAHDEFSYDEEGNDKKYGLSYSIILGFNSNRLDFSFLKEKGAKVPAEPMGVVMVGVRGGKGEVENPYFNKYLLENGDVYFTAWTEGKEDNIVFVNNYHASHSHSYLNWDYTYRTTRFDKATGWSGWMKINPGVPYDNPPRDDDGNIVFEDPNLNDIFGDDLNIWE